MKYKSYNNDSVGCLTFIVVIILALGLMLGFNSCTSTEWNGGVCVSCETKYELRAVNEGLKYYACPECGNEVARYFGR